MITRILFIKKSKTCEDIHRMVFDIFRDLINMVEEEDMIIVNTKIKRFRSIILDLLKKFLEIKRKDGSINNAKIKKEKLKFIGEQSLEDIQKQLLLFMESFLMKLFLVLIMIFY